MLQVMNIGSTNSSLFDLDQDLVGTDLGDGPLIVSSRQRKVELETYVLDLDLINGV
jgi:hypothetical protein